MFIVLKPSMIVILRIPTINDYSSDFIKLFKLREQVEKCKGIEVIFDFSKCGFLRQNAVAFIGGLARLINHYGGQAKFSWDTMQNNIRANLVRNGFMAAFGGEVSGYFGNSIPYRQDICGDIDDSISDVMTYLDDQWLGRSWVNIDPFTKDEVVQTVLELYRNAFEYGDSPVGIFTCGQHYPNIRQLKLSIVDFGIGIPHNIRLHLQKESLLASDALQWAFQKGNTTRQCVPGGNGLDMVTLKRFVSNKKGRINIYSNDGQIIIAPAKNEIYQSTPIFFKGTMINISIQCN